MQEDQKQAPMWEGTVPGDDSRGFSKGKIMFLFVIGFLLGVSIKAQAIRSITMGADDYKASRNKSTYPLVKEPAVQPEGNRPTQGDTPQPGETPAEGDNLIEVK